MPPKRKKKIGTKRKTYKTKTRSKSANAKVKSKSEVTRFFKVPSQYFLSKEHVIKSFGYRLEKKLDEGGYGTIFIANDNRKKMKVACKWMDLGTCTNDPRMLDTHNELTVLEQVRHPYIIKVLCHFIVQADGINNMYIFMELAGGGNLYKYLQKQGLPNEELSGKYFAQILCGINHMHGYGIAHRDIKLQNVLLVENARSISGDFLMRVSDFGLSTTVKKDTYGNVQLNNTTCGTPLFMAPELIDRKPYDAYQVDVWALGISLYLILTLDVPFNFRQNLPNVVTDMKAKKWEWSDQMLSKPSPLLDSLMKSMLEPEPSQRIRLEDIINHKWISSYYQAAHALSDQLKAEEYMNK